ncbi:protein kinase domain-containing protein [Cystobacter fuscus]
MALKFVRDGAPDLAQRFLSEARAQARVHHERVCEMYEVGEIQGRAFIAMQYVNGHHLGQLSRELTLEQKLLVLRDVAEGVHAAHRAGLIHRDLKPSNILVERAEDGGLKPYVMDFGLARDWHEEHTATGDVLGTPHYMAPEQARGEVGKLDRRVDVYSLGATLYRCSRACPLHRGQCPGAAQPHPDRGAPPAAAARGRPPPGRGGHRPQVPGEGALGALRLGTRARRGPGALPLRRARARAPRGAGLPAGQELRKHRLVVGLGSLALTGVLLALGQAALTRREVALRERLAQRFTERVERLEAQARYSALSPLHDTRPDRRALREGMKALEEDIRLGGAAAEAPGHYAVGRTLLALGDPEGALARLESAWEGGYHEARVAYALALALGQLYQEQLKEVEWVKDTAQREPADGNSSSATATPPSPISSRARAPRRPRPTMWRRSWPSTRDGTSRR